MRFHSCFRARPVTRRALIVLLALLVAGAAACSSDATAAKPTSTTAAQNKVAFEVQGTTVDSPGAEIAFPAGVQARLTKSLDTWANGAVLDPLHTGAAGNIGPFFSAATAPRVAEGAPDHQVFYEGALETTEPVTVKYATTTFTGLADPQGAIQLVNAQVNLALSTATATGPVTVNRAGNIVFVPTEQGWQVGYYDLAVDRTGKGLPRASDSTSSTTTKDH